MAVKEKRSLLSKKELSILQAAEKYGIDLSILEGNLRLSPTERLEKLRARLAFSAQIAESRKRKVSNL